jgi:hypothetical protein
MLLQEKIKRSKIKWDLNYVSGKWI